MLEVQNRALIKSARERAQRIGNLEHELEQANRALERLKTEVERLKSEREFGIWSVNQAGTVKKRP